MRIILAAVLTVAGAAALLFARPDAVRAADSAGPAPVAAAAAVAAPLDPAPVPPGTIVDERDYAQREAESPEVQEFVGGDCGFAWFILFAALVVVLILYLNKENKI